MEETGNPPARTYSLRHRLVVFALAVVAPVAVGAVLSGLILLDATRSFNDRAEEVAMESEASLGLFKALGAAGSAGSAYMDGEGPRRAFDAAAQDVDRRLGAATYDEGAETAAVRRVRSDWRAAGVQLRANPPGGAEEPGDGPDPEDLFEASIDSATAGVDRLLDLSEAENRTDLAETQRLWREQGALAILALLASIALAAFLVRRLSREMVRPIRRLTRAARAFGEGDLEHRVHVNSSAELHEMAGSFNTIAGALQDQREQLERQAFEDSLTGIPNRALFEDRIRHALDRRVTTNETLAVLVVDVDDFKLVNEGLGHAAGDALIEQAAARLMTAVRPSDTVARIGGDEFAVLLEGIRGPDDAIAAAERLRRAFAEPFPVSGSSPVVTASVGIALSRDQLGAEELLRRADRAVHRFKETGKDGWTFFDPRIQDRATERLETVTALRGAVERGELVVHYQPIVDLDTGEAVSVEALLRWRREGQELVPPADFIPLAEETGLIVPLGAWVMGAACAEAMRWRRAGAGDVNVCVNVSARQLMDPNFESTVTGALEETGLDPAGLTIEVTETSVMQDPEGSIAKLGRLRDRGIGIALDDFGEGHSSLSHLRHLPVRGLKIARPFIQGLGDGDDALVRGIIELARSLRLRLVAEGIETPEQREQLRLLGCRLGQGFLFSRPVEPAAIRSLLSEQVGAPAGA
ncbi:MAG: EAL domain-containing protein [Thermoleophilaceae bacterium]|nr:EAL domain-containing protein [Thermoleophilaceae bacterium]